MEQPISKNFQKNVYVLRCEDVIRRGDQVFTPIYMELAQLKKSPTQYRKGVEFTTGMTDHAVKSKLEKTFPILRNQRFSCAEATRNDRKLDFHGEHRVWDGRTLKRILVSNKALYIVMEDNQESSSSDSESEWIGSRRDSRFSYWTQGECLGAGNFGKVYKCRTWKHEIFAVKVVKMEPQYTETQEEVHVKALNNEIRILKNLKHTRIVSYYGTEQKDGHLHLFMDFMAGGSLSDHIKKNGVLSECLSKRYTKQMLEGVYFLHSQDIIHRDIKGSNVLLDGHRNVKLADFGLSKMIQKVGSKTNLVSHCGTPYWMAPEIFRGEGYGRRADIWSLGCTVVEMLTGKPPLGHLEPAAAIFRIGSRPLELTLPESVSQDAKKFIKAALTWKPDERPWSDELQRYDFILDRIPDEPPWCDEVERFEFLSIRIPDEPPWCDEVERFELLSKRIPDVPSWRNELERLELLSKRRKMMIAVADSLSVKAGTPSNDELKELAFDIALQWKKLGRRLGLVESVLDGIDQDNEELSKKGYRMLRKWKQQRGSEASYEALYDALQHPLVQRRDLAVKFCSD